MSISIVVFLLLVLADGLHNGLEHLSFEPKQLVFLDLDWILLELGRSRVAGRSDAGGPEPKLTGSFIVYLWHCHRLKNKYGYE